MAKIKKTPTELKYEAMLRSQRKKLERKRAKKNKHKPKPKPPPFESEKERYKMSYPIFLQSKYWALVRKEVLKRDGYKCIICQSDKELNIHHDSYKHHPHELKHLQDLMTLCRVCHREHHYAQS